MDVPFWAFGLMLFLIQCPTLFVKDMTTFSKYHAFADLIILITVLSIGCFTIVKASKDGFGENVVAVNTNTWANMVSFSVYLFEGMGLSKFF